MENKKYLDLVKDCIELDKLLASTDSKYHTKIKDLLNKKKKIIEKNSFFANLQLKSINRKIEKIKNKS